MKTIRIFIILILLTMTLGTSVSAKGKRKKRVRYYSLNAELSLLYDDNILRYSDYYINQFLSGENNGRFHIETYDDMIIAPKIQLGYKRKYFNFGITEAAIFARYNKYFVNPVKNWAQYSASIKQTFFRNSSLNFQYTYTPHYYIRHYRDKEWLEFVGVENAFKEYSFAKDDFSFTFEQKIIPRLYARLYYAFIKYYYSEYFTEHDARQNLFGARIFYEFNERIKGNFGIKRLTSDARGKTGVDPSYYELKYYLGFGAVLPDLFGIDNSVSFLAIYNERRYESKYSYVSDPVHAGRHDKYYGLYFYWKTRPARRSTVVFYLNFNARDSKTAYAETTDLLSRDKDFSQFRFGLKYKYLIKF